MTRETYADGSYYGFGHDAAHQLTAFEAFNAAGVSYGPAYAGSFAYDANGSAISRTNGDGSTRAFTYDVLGRLAGHAQSGQPAQTYAYDHAGRRIGKSVAGGYSLAYLYDGQNVHADYLAGWGAASALYTHGPGEDDVLMIQEAGQPARYQHADGLGSVVMQTGTVEGTGYAIHAIQRYDAWGNVTDAPTGSISAFAYTGRERDETGLMYYRARYYYPGFARFMQRDPLGLSAGLNPYSYVGNNPTNYRDPSGLLAAPAWKTLDTNWLTAARDYTVGADLSGGLEAGVQSLALVACGPGCAGVLPGQAMGPRLPGVPGFGGQAVQRTEPGGFEAQLGLIASPPPSTGWVQRAIDFILDQPRLFIENLGNLIFNEGNSGGENPFASAGRQAHQQEPYPEGFEREVSLPSGRRMDAYNADTREVIELKPDNPRAVQRGERQVEQYCLECDRVYGPGHTGRVQTYDPSKYLKR